MDAIIKNGKIDGVTINLYQKVGTGKCDNKCAFCRKTQEEGWDMANSEEFIHFGSEAFRICNECSIIFSNYVDKDGIFIPFFTFKATYYFEQTPCGLPHLEGRS
jgi:hypothetical protein